MNPRNKFAIALATLTVTAVFGFDARAQSERIELAEARAALAAALEQNRALRAESAQLQLVNKNLGESLLVSNSEAEDFRKAYSDMRLQMEALGIESVTEGTKGVQDRLARLVGDMQLLEVEKSKLSDALIALSDAALKFVETAVSPSPEARAEIESAVADADKALGFGTALASAPADAGVLQDSRIVSVKKDFGVVVLNVGRKSGVRIGMPFEIRRVDRPIGSVIVVDTRENICAALVQNLNAADSPQVGDTAAVATTE